MNELSSRGNNQRILNTLKSSGRPDHWEMLTVDTFSDTSKLEFIGKDGTAATANWTAANNILTSPSGQALDIFAIAKDIRLNDGRVSVIWENPNPAQSGTNWGGLLLRGNGMTDFLGVFIFPNSQRLELWKLVNGVYTSISNVVLSGGDTIVANVPVAITAEIVGLSLKVYLNGKLITTSTHADITTFMYGRCGIGAARQVVNQYSNFSVARKRFDYIRPDIKKVVCVGSSITYGVSITTPYPIRLQAKLNANFAASPITVVNEGISGNTTTQMLARFANILTNHKPDVVVIETSVNDARLDERGNFSFAATLNNLRQMIKMAKAAGAVPLLTTATGIDYTIASGNWDVTCYRLIYQMNVRSRQLALQENIRLVDNHFAFNNDSSLLLPDKLHPNDAGAEVFATTVYNTIVGNY